ncbi:unnamed protein product [Rangifer tarandus platyrhynchus]|uniref:Uncharacterized protein n=1 Tax=Rangifer tarandus platyrhynchus TaxID=3082113 RepID=A0AC59YPY9_RANTA
MPEERTDPWPGSLRLLAELPHPVPSFTMQRVTDLEETHEGTRGLTESQVKESMGPFILKGRNQRHNNGVSRIRKEIPGRMGNSCVEIGLERWNELNAQPGRFE